MFHVTNELISMPTIVELMQKYPNLYILLDREEVTPTEIMALRPCLKLTCPAVIEALNEINTNQAKEIAIYSFNRPL